MILQLQGRDEKGIRLKSGAVPVAVSFKTKLFVFRPLSALGGWEGTKSEASQKTCQLKINF